MASNSGSKDIKASYSDEHGDFPQSSLVAKTLSKTNLTVDHSYTDYAIIKEEDDIKLVEEETPKLSKPLSEREAEVREKLKGMTCTYGPSRKNSGGVSQPFPGKLMEVLSRTDLAEIIEWMPHGRAFLVKQPKTFASQVLPRYFKQSKYLSFTRQLNLWGFKRITRGKDMGCYYHEIFLRGRPHLAMRMKRQKIKGTGMKLTPDPDSEPDFYNDYPMMPELKQAQGPLPPLPSERVGMITQADAVDASSQNLFKALQVASSHQLTKMPPSMLSHPQLQQIHQQQQLLNAATGGGMMPNGNSFLGAMNSALSANKIFSSGSLQHQIQQQQSLQQKQQQLQQAGKATHGLGTANAFQNLYGAMNHQNSINPMLAAASQLPPMVPSAMLTSNHLSTHIAKLAYNDVLLAPGIRKQLGLGASSLDNKSTAAGSIGGNLNANSVKDQLSSVMLHLNKGANPGQLNNTQAPQANVENQIQTAHTQSAQSKTKDDADTRITGGGQPPAAAAAAASSSSAPATTVVAAATKKAKSAPPPAKKSEGKDVFGYDNDPLQDALKKVGNDPLQDALQKVHKLDDDAASLQRAKAKILQSMAQSGVDPTDMNDEEEKNNVPV